MIGYLGRSIPRRILASLIAIYLVTYVSTALVVYSGVRASVLEANGHALQQLAELKYDRLAGVFDALATDILAWSQLDVMNDIVSEDIDKRVARTLEELKARYSLTGDIYAFDQTGRLLASSRPDWADDRGSALPPAWQTDNPGVAFLDKHLDRFTGAPAVVLEAPIFASFDRNFRIGTLVLSYPWSAVETLLFAGDAGTMLVEDGILPQILAADAMARAAGSKDRALIGRSIARDPLIGRWEVRVIRETDTVAQALNRVGIELVLLGLCLAVPIVLLGRWLSNRLMAPVLQLTRVVQEIAATDRLDARVPVSSADELGTLARAFNHMAESLHLAAGERERFVAELEALNQTLEAKVAARTRELEAAVKAQHRLIGDISHEIKSPLARLEVALALARRAMDPRADRQFDRMEREISAISALASELLTLARLDAGPIALETATFDLVTLIRQIQADAIFEAPERETDLELATPDGALPVLGNADLLRRAIENVVRNALFYTAPGTPIAITARRLPENGVAITIRDQGPGVPAAALPHLFEPFYRVDEARTRKTGGAGIGLAICQRVVSRHAGTVRARANQPSGLVVEITLPAQPAADR